MNLNYRKNKNNFMKDIKVAKNVAVVFFCKYAKNPLDTGGDIIK